jgi:hypothetical protein
MIHHLVPRKGRHTLLLLVGALLALSACGEQPPTVIAPVNVTAMGGAAIFPTATPLPPTPIPNVPTQTVLTMIAYGHSSRVFSLNMPQDWDVVDDSTPQRLLVTLIPPPGYGSRVMVEVTHEGMLSPEEVSSLAESYIRLHYLERPGYIEVSRNILHDGRLQYVHLFDDHQGATGRETLTIQQAGPYFVALRVFLSDRDVGSLGTTLEALAASLLVDPMAGWGSEIAAINPAELHIGNTYLWRDRDGVTHYGGDLFNGSPTAIEDVLIEVAFCDSAGIVLKQMTQPAALTQVARESSTPFGMTVNGLPENINVCGEEASAQPAHLNPTYTNQLSLAASVSYHQWRRDLTISGPIANYSLSPVNRVKVIVVAYDADNRVIGFVEVPLDAGIEIQPGQSYEFETVMPAVASVPDHVVTLVQANVVVTVNHSLAPTP